MSSTFSSRVRRPGADAEPAPGESAGRARRVWSVVPVCVGFAVFGAIVWLAYQDVSLGPPVGEPPLIKAAAEPIKLPPEQVQEPTLAAEQGTVGRLWSDAEQDDQPERLLPPPEQPLSPPVTEPPASAGQTLEQPSALPAPQGTEMAETGADRAAGDASVAAPPAAPTDAPGAASAQPQTDESLQEAEAALDRLLAEVTALPEDKDAPEGSAAAPEASAAAPAASQPAVEVRPAKEESPASAAAPAASQPAVEVPSAGEESPASAPAPTTVAAAAPERAVPARPAQKPASPAPAAAPRVSTEVRPAGALTGAPAPAAQARAGPTETAAISGAGAPIATAPVAPDGEFRIQLAAVRGEADARRAWNLFMADLGPVLSDIAPIFERADTANGVFYRVQIGPFASQQAAESLCEELKRRNASCFVIRR